MDARDLLVTGTDTSVGKTVIAAGLLVAARAQGQRAVGFKPAETGFDAGLASDSEVLAAAADVDEPLARPLLRLHEPLTPALAAERAGLTFEPRAVLERVAALRAAGYRLVLEGAGGLLAPLAWDWTALDLAAQAELDVVLVARAGLGTLNHTLLSAAVLRARGVTLRAVVLNGRGQPATLAEETNPAALARLLPGLAIVNVPLQPDVDALGAARRAAPALRDLVSA